MVAFRLHERLEADSFLMCDLPLSQLRLHNIKSVPWLILIPRKPEITEIYQLSAPERSQLIEEATQASKALLELYAPDKINIAALGNMVPQLHVHVIARFVSDQAWPEPVFGKVELEPYDAQSIIAIRSKLSDQKFWS